MKKLLVILLLTTPFIGFGQACQYGSSTDASSICNFYQSRNFATYRNADIALDKILDVTGMSKRFVLKECNDISNCLATTYKGIRYILYDRDFMDAIATRTNSWSSTSILAHEIGHHVNGHTLGEESTLSESRQMEIEADEYSGFVMFKLGASLSQAQEAIRLMSTNDDDSYSTHPAKDKRLRAIAKGYNKAKGQGSNNDYSTNSLTAEDYFYKAYNNESDWQYQIDNYTKCLRIDPEYDRAAYFNRALAYDELEKLEDAIADYTRALRIDPDYASAYKNRANVKSKMGEHQGAIADCNKGMRIDPDDATFYLYRGDSYYELGEYQDAIADFSKGMRMDPNDPVFYYFRGITYDDLGKQKASIADFKKCCNLGDKACCEEYNNAKGKGSNSSSVTADKYYDNAYNNESDWQYQIDNYTKCLRIDPDYDISAYLNRGQAYNRLENYEDAIADYTRAIRIDPDYARAYKSRGIAKENAGLPYCSDYKRACELGNEDGCEWYNEQCR